MFRNIITFGLMLATAGIFNLSAQGIKGNGDVTSEDRSISNFDAVQINGACHLYIRQGNTHSLRIETDENLHDIITSDVEDGVLTIGQEESIRKQTKMNVYITVRELRKIDVYGACELETENTLKVDQLKVGVYGASSMKMDLEVSQLATVISGAGNADLQGRADQVKFDIDGTGAIKAYELEADMVDVNISGMGSAKVNARERLDVDISGMASVNYKGSPEIRKSISGMGSLNRD